MMAGSFTVEAALVMPVVLLTVFGVITFSMWQRDMTVMQARMLESIEIARTTSEDQGMEMLSSTGGVMLYSTFGNAGPMEGAKNKIVAAVSGKPGGIFEGFDRRFTGSVTRACYDPVSFLRKVNLAQSLINR